MVYGRWARDRRLNQEDRRRLAPFGAAASLGCGAVKSHPARKPGGMGSHGPRVAERDDYVLRDRVHGHQVVPLSRPVGAGDKDELAAGMQNVSLPAPVDNELQQVLYGGVHLVAL